MASVAMELNFKLYLISIDLNVSLNNHMWLVATILHSTDIVWYLLGLPSGNHDYLLTSKEEKDLW